MDNAEMTDRILSIGGYAAVTTITAIALAAQGIIAAAILCTVFGD